MFGCVQPEVRWWWRAAPLVDSGNQGMESTTTSLANVGKEGPHSSLFFFSSFFFSMTDSTFSKSTSPRYLVSHGPNTQCDTQNVHVQRSTLLTFEVWWCFDACPKCAPRGWSSSLPFHPLAPMPCPALPGPCKLQLTLGCPSLIAKLLCSGGGNMSWYASSGQANPHTRHQQVALTTLSAAGGNPSRETRTESESSVLPRLFCWCVRYQNARYVYDHYHLSTTCALRGIISPAR